MTDSPLSEWVPPCVEPKLVAPERAEAYLRLMFGSEAETAPQSEPQVVDVAAVVDQVHKEVGSRMRLVRLSDALQNKTPPEYLAKSRLPAHGTSTLYAASNAGKTWVAVDLACRIAGGLSWLGSKVKQGPVVYLVGEGLGGLRVRFAAWQRANPGFHDLPIFLSDKGGSLFTGLGEVISEIDAIESDPVLIVVDTRARWFEGGDENSTRDAGTFVRNLDELQSRYNCHVLSVHHTGKDQGRGDRGSSAFRAAEDCTINLTKEQVGDLEVLTASWEKVRDGRKPLPGRWELRSVVLPDWLDEDGNPVESACVAAVDYVPPSPGKPRIEVPFEAIRNLVIEFPKAGRNELVRIIADRFGASQRTASTRLSEAEGKGYVVKKSGGAGKKSAYEAGEVN